MMLKWRHATDITNMSQLLTVIVYSARYRWRGAPKILVSLVYVIVAVHFLLKVACAGRH